jgi:DNA-binding MarR family transcriptional regulator
MNVRITSREAFASIRTTIGPMQAAVYRSIDRNVSICNMDIAEDLGMPINSVTGRTKELRDMNLVEEDEKIYHPKTGRLVITWKIKRG